MALLFDDIAGARGLTSEERETWRQLRGEADAAATCGPFDYRHVLELSGAALDAWTLRREAWLRTLFAGDPRVAM